jgi:hypothetical protein
LIAEGLVDGAIGTLTNFFELSVVGLDLHKNEIIIISKGERGKSLQWVWWELMS